MYKAHFNNITMSIKDFLDMFTNQLILNDDIWIYDEDKEFPCIALLTNCNDKELYQKRGFLIKCNEMELFLS